MLFVASALPPAVRRRLCPAVDAPFMFWAMPFGPASAKQSDGAKPARRAEPRNQLDWCRRGLATADEVNSGGKAEPTWPTLEQSLPAVCCLLSALFLTNSL